MGENFHKVMHDLGIVILEINKKFDCLKEA